MVSELARRFDDYISIDVGWKRGDASKFAKWLRRYEANGLNRGNRLAAILREAGAEETISECGGGKDAVYWFDLGRVVIGLPNTSADGWVIPVSELSDMPDVYPEEDEAEPS